VQTVRNQLLEALKAVDLAIDFGGSAGPLGYGSVIVDPESSETPTLYDVPGLAGLIFTSHTLEHLKDVGLAVSSLVAKLHVGGYIIAHVPSWKREHLRAENWPHHHQTFRLAADRDAPPEYLALDYLFGASCETVVGMDDGKNILYGVRRIR
jgi:hypothetical protein